MKAKKSLGQHFLKSEKVLRDITDTADLTPLDIALEIGPGEGILTKELLTFAGKVVAIEKDWRLIPFLKEKFRKEIEKGSLDILEKDILKFDPYVMSFYDRPYKVIANIPYYITGQIIRMFLETKSQPESMTLLIQKEVAERIVAKNGKESLLSLSVKIFGDPRYIRAVGRGAFTPAPTVDSAILVIENISRKKLRDIDEKLFFIIIHAGFAHKRKQLLPNLSTLYKKDILINAFKVCGIDIKSRAEDVLLETWLKLCNTIGK